MKDTKRRAAQVPPAALTLGELFELMNRPGAARQRHPAYRRLVSDQNFANAIRRYRQAYPNPRLPSPGIDDEEYVETKILFCVLDCLVEARRPRRKRPSNKMRRGAVKSIKRVMRFFESGMQLSDAKEQGQLESLLQQLLDAQTARNPKRTYSGARVHGRRQLQMLASTMLDGFWWCSPEFLLDVASMASLDRDLSTMKRYIALEREHSPARFVRTYDPEAVPTPEQNAAIDAELDRLGVKPAAQAAPPQAYKSGVRD